MENPKFNKEEERVFKQYLFDTDIKFTRRMLILGVLIYSSFALLDFFLEVKNMDIYFMIRFLMVAPAIIIILFLSFHKLFFSIHQYLLTFLLFVAEIGIVFMLILDPDQYSYFGGLFLVIMFGYQLIGLRWKYATFVSTVVVLIYLVLSIIYVPLNVFDSVIYSLFYFGFIFIAGFSSFKSASYRRENYIHEMSLKDDNVILERKIYDNLLDLENSNRITVYSFAKLAESRDMFTGEHIDRVGSLCLKLATIIDESVYVKNNLDKATFLEYIELASTLHDIGKVGISENVLMKPGPLNNDEREHMKKHCELGSITLTQIKEKYPKNNFINMGIEICMSHHENWDGTGYPEGLSGKDIPFSARLVAIIDVYDALISERPYKRKFSIDKSRREIKLLVGSKFDPDIAKAFNKLF